MRYPADHVAGTMRPASARNATDLTLPPLIAVVRPAGDADLQMMFGEPRVESVDQLLRGLGRSGAGRRSMPIAAAQSGRQCAPALRCRASIPGTQRRALSDRWRCAQQPAGRHRQAGLRPGSASWRRYRRKQRWSSRSATDGHLRAGGSYGESCPFPPRPPDPSIADVLLLRAGEMACVAMSRMNKARTPSRADRSSRRSVVIACWNFRPSTPLIGAGYQRPRRDPDLAEPSGSPASRMITAATTASGATPPVLRAFALTDRDARSQKLFFHLRKITVGTLTVSTGRPPARLWQPAQHPQAELRIFDDSLFGDLLSGGEWGLGWGYVHRKWDAENVKAVCLIFMLNEDLSPLHQAGDGGLAVDAAGERAHGSRSEHRRAHPPPDHQRLLRRRQRLHTLDAGAQHGLHLRHLAAPDATLEEAQENKFRIITEKARIEPQHSVLELGCGFGSLSNYIHKTTGARPRAVALSRQQIRWAQEHYPHLDFAYLNYVHVMTGLYDRIVSVGMGEHVGRQNFDAFLRQIAGLLKPGGRFVCHHDELLRRRLDVQPGQALDLVRFGHHAQRRCLFDDRSHQGGAQDWRAAHRAHRDLWPALRTHRRGWLANCRRHREKIVAAYSDEFFRIYEYSWQMGAAAFETGMTLLHVVFEKQPYGADYREASSTLAPAAGEGHAGSTLFWPRRGHHQGTSGIGAAIARRLVSEGAEVVLAARRSNRVKPWCRAGSERAVFFPAMSRSPSRYER